MKYEYYLRQSRNKSENSLIQMNANNHKKNFFFLLIDLMRQSHIEDTHKKSKATEKQNTNKNKKKIAKMYSD